MYSFSEVFYVVFVCCCLPSIGLEYLFEDLHLPRMGRDDVVEHSSLNMK